MRARWDKFSVYGHWALYDCETGMLLGKAGKQSFREPVSAVRCDSIPHVNLGYFCDTEHAKSAVERAVGAEVGDA